MPKKQRARRQFNRGGVQSQRVEERIVSGKETRTRYTIRQKITIVEYAMVRMEEDLASMNEIADEVGISTSSLSRWMDQLPQLRHINRHDQVRVNMNRAGRTSSLENISADLLAFVNELRDRGHAVSRKMIVMTACKLAAEDFMVTIARPAVNQPYRDRNFIINMDQTPVFFSMHPSRSVDTIGSRTVNIRIAKNGSQRATVAVSFTASGIQLKSLVIFKGMCFWFSLSYHDINIYFISSSSFVHLSSRQRGGSGWKNHQPGRTFVSCWCVVCHSRKGLDE